MPNPVTVPVNDDSQPQADKWWWGEKDGETLDHGPFASIQTAMEAAWGLDSTPRIVLIGQMTPISDFYSRALVEFDVAPALLDLCIETLEAEVGESWGDMLLPATHFNASAEDKAQVKHLRQKLHDAMLPVLEAELPQPERIDNVLCIHLKGDGDYFVDNA